MKQKPHSPMNTLKPLPIPLSQLLLSIVLLLVTGGLMSCKEPGENGSGQTTELVNTDPAFKMVEIPTLLVDAESRAAYLVSHYWDHFDFSDTTYIHLPEITEQAFANYLSILPHAEPLIATTSIKQMLQRAATEDSSGQFYAYLLDRCKAYLADPNSPLRNEEFYIPVLEFILNDSLSDETTRANATYDLTLLLKNRVGTKATNFTYATATQRGKLWNIRSTYTLIYFYNPDCHACEEATAYIHHSPVMTHLLTNNQLTILAVYPDEDLSVWKEHQENLPAEWMNAYDPLQQLNTKQLYDLKAMPTLYLLDSQKQILLKDATPEQVELYFNQQIIQ